MTVEIISRSISTKVWDWAWIELATPGIAVRHASVARHVTDCATRPVGGGGVEGVGWGYDETVDIFRGLSQNWTIFGSYF